MSWIILSSISGAIVAYAVTKVMCIKFLSELKTIEKKHREGYRGGTWVLLDYGCVVVHVFNDEARKFYSLEHLWADGEEVDLSAILPHAE